MDETLYQLLAFVDESAEELITLHQALVRIPTVNTGHPESGNEIQVCHFLKDRFQAEGIPTVLLESAPSRGNLLASIGEPATPRLLLMSHTDVVPIEDESEWRVSPFSGEIIDGKVYGRGSDDAKSLVSTGAMTLILLKRAGIQLQGALRFLAAADEEAGGQYGIAWLADHHPDEVRADWAINEGGGAPVMTPGGPAYFVAVGEKGRMEARFRFEGRSGHAARPWLADNALYKVAGFLDRLWRYEPEVDASSPLFQHLRLFGIEDTPTSGNVDQLIEQLAQYDPSFATTLTAASRMSVTPTMISAGVKSNSIPASAELICDIRSLPHQDEPYVRRELTQMMQNIDGVNLELNVTAISNASPYDSPFVDHLRRATEIALGREDVTWGPGITVGFTDSRCVRPLGTQVYGFAPLLPESDTVRSGVHGVDEAMEIDNLVFRTKMQVVLAYLMLVSKEG